VVTHMRPHLKLRSSHPSPPMKRDSFPPELHSYLVHVNAPRRQPTLAYRPLLLPDEFLTRREWVPVSPDPARLDPQFTFSIVPVPLIGFTVYSTLGESMRMLQSGAGLSEEDLDELKELVSGSNLRWWALTTLVSLLHGLFSYLAFSNDVGFWRGKTSLEGLSIRSFFSSLVCQLIIFLKLCDGGNVSWLILVEVGIGVAIEAWKVSKIMARRGMLSLGYWTGKGATAGTHAMSQLESDTDEADARAMRYLSYVLYPVVVVWGLYSLVYHDHRGWWSWTVQTAAYGVYLYGFVAMTPQLYINYRLKSVAHLPWRAMGYKVFNTFIDDVFAFAIEMPLSHRIACLRDDVIFFGFLYQRWIYPVDKARANEFGRAYEGKEDAAPALDAGPSKPSIASAAASGTPAGSAVSEDETKKER
jgi:Cleft lip and palate transmembrane protein 1 (CLPTM1)